MPVPLTSCEIDDRGGSCSDGVHLGVDLMLRLIHLVLDPYLGCLGTQRKTTTTSLFCMLEIHLNMAVILQTARLYITICHYDFLLWLFSCITCIGSYILQYNVVLQCVCTVLYHVLSQWGQVVHLP